MSLGKEQHQQHNCTSCSHVSTQQPSVHQTLHELEFERGLWSAALDGDVYRIGKLLSCGNDVNAIDTAGYTPLHYAARAGNMEACKLLLRNGAIVDCRTRAGKATPLHRAAARGHLDICKLLVDAGANLDIKDSDGKNATDRANDSKHQDIVNYLKSVT